MLHLGARFRAVCPHCRVPFASELRKAGSEPEGAQTEAAVTERRAPGPAPDGVLNPARPSTTPSSLIDEIGRRSGSSRRRLHEGWIEDEDGYGYEDGPGKEEL